MNCARQVDRNWSETQTPNAAANATKATTEDRDRHHANRVNRPARHADEHQRGGRQDEPAHPPDRRGHLRPKNLGAGQVGGRQARPGVPFVLRRDRTRRRPGHATITRADSQPTLNRSVSSRMNRLV